MPNIAFLGSGRMASAIVDGLLAQTACAPADLTCTDGGDGTAAALATRTGITAAPDLATLFARGTVDFVVHNDLANREAGSGAFPADIWPAGGERVIHCADRPALAVALEKLLAAGPSAATV